MKQKIDTKKGGKNIWLLGSSSMFNDVGSEMITPILPFYISTLGGGGVAIGLISGLREGLSSLFKILGGWLSDRTGKRRNFIFLGYLISVISRFLLVMAGSWQQITTLLSIERFGKLRDAPRDAIISVSTKKRGRGFGFHQMMDTSGGVIGTLIVLLLFWKLNFEFVRIIFIAAAISILSLIPLFFVKEPKMKKSKKNLFEGFKKMNRKLKYFIFVSSVFTLANFGMYMFLILRAKEITGSVAFALGLYILFSLAYAVFAVPFGSLSDRVGRKKVLLVGYTLFLIVSLAFTNSINIFSLSLLFILYGVVYAIVTSTQRAFVSDLSGNMKGTALGFYHGIIGLVNIPAGLIAGILWDIHYSIMFWYVSVVALISIIFLLFVKEENEFRR